MYNSHLDISNRRVFQHRSSDLHQVFSRQIPTKSWSESVHRTFHIEHFNQTKVRPLACRVRLGLFPWVKVALLVQTALWEHLHTTARVSAYHVHPDHIHSRKEPTVARNVHLEQMHHRQWVFIAHPVPKVNLPHNTEVSNATLVHVEQLPLTKEVPAAHPLLTQKRVRQPTQVLQHHIQVYWISCF